MKIIERDHKTLSIGLEGKLDMNTSETTQRELMNALEEATELIVDCSALEYISSAGIRVLLTVQKEMVRRGGAETLRKVNEDIYDILEISGFTEIANVRRD